MLFLPPGIDCHFSIKKHTHVLVLEIGDLAAVCYHFLPTDMIPSIPLNESLFYTLDLKIQLYRWLVNMKDYLQDGRFDDALISIKTFELFCLIKHCYSIEELGKFFAPAMQDEYKFALFILSHYSSVKTAEELAHLSNYSFSAFEKQFRKVFGMAPYRWMLQRKIRKVYREIYETSIPLKVIADEFGFSGLSQLSDFCRKHFGLSPVAIRNKRKNNEEL
ncbi:MAG: AraC family transcriptional regulator [Tannerellaceae bacterium]|nr:AraC family transcriptional regulator [Tannerellaceae bacterium]